MRQLRSGPGESGSFFSYLFAVFWLFNLVSALEPVKTRTRDVKKSEFSNSRGQSSSKEISAGPPKEVAVVRRNTDYGLGRKGGIVSSYTGQTQRNLNDYEPTDFVLMSTVAGTLHARDRMTGKPIWHLQTDDQAVETINHLANSSSPEDNIQWIVEPSEDGQLLFYTPEGGLERVGITVKDIIHQTPYMPPGVDKIYNGAKNTTTYAINARTGVIQRVFSAGGSPGVVNDRKCKTVTKLPDLEDECDPTEGSDKTIILGRTEYTITIQRWSTAENLWTIKFNEWGPNNSDQDLRAQYQHPLDNRFIYSFHDGSIVGMDAADTSGMRPPKFNHVLDSPVVRIFDVVKSLAKQDSDDLLVLPQPPMRATKDEDELKQLDNVFVGNRGTGGLYALSEANFPYVTRQASNAGVYGKAGPWKSLPAPERERSLIGIHKVRYSGPEPIRASLPAPTPYEDESHRRSNSNQSPPASNPSLSGIPIIDKVATGPGYFGVMSMSAGTILLALFLAGAKFGHPKFDLPLSRSAIVSRLTTTPTSEPVAQLPITETEPVTAAAPIVILDPPVLQPVNEKLEEQLTEEHVIAAAFAVPRPEDPKLENPNPIEQEVEVQEDRIAPALAVRFQEPELANEPRVTGQNGEAAPLSTPKKKKYQRGRRGGKKKSSMADNGNTAASGNSPAEKVENAGQVARAAPSTIKIITEDGTELETKPPLVLNNLVVHEDVLIGSGSQGTTVHRGAWENKVVAVKRILTTHADIALKEVKTLQDADYHANVVRYYCQQEHGQFVYIALEMCPGSLYDVIDKPHKYQSLVNMMETRETLRQITQGVNHLHSLKIIHRDIKPQNILVGAPNFRSKHPRLLISDFGLCKKLQADEYSFGATTAQGAGTVGWRAPELLDKAAQELNDQEHSGSGTVTGSEVVEDPITKRRVTRLIDIFPLGCTFYFVISRGEHPFGTKYNREYNIMFGKSTVHKLVDMDDGGIEAAELVARMIEHDPKKRPDTATIGADPYFWDAEKKLDFLSNVSDRFENDRERAKSEGIISPALELVAEREKDIVGENWLNKLDPHLYADLTEKRRRGYDGTRLVDLLRVIRNKRNHFLDMSPPAQQAVGETPEQFYKYFGDRYPNLLMYSYQIARGAGWYTETRFSKFRYPPWL